MRAAADTILFGYGRTSTTDQTTENQRLELERAGWPIRAWFQEQISGGTMAAQRPQFQRLLQSIQSHLDTGQKVALVVSRLDRLGRDAIDVQTTLKMLDEKNVRVYVHQLGDLDLTSKTAKPMVAMLCAFAEMERDLIRERTQSGLARVKAEGKTLGRPAKTTQEDRREINRLLAAGTSVSQVARDYGISRSTVISIRAGVC